MKKRIPLQALCEPSSMALVGIKPPKKFRVLVVDDETCNVEVLTRYLTREGYDVAFAYNGEEALAKIAQACPDIILLDVMMPVMGGLAVCQTLREDFFTQSIPIIFLTAKNELPDRLKGLKAGVDDYMGKPFELEEVKVRLESVLKRRRLDLSSSPLTHLPGNPAIEEEVWKRLRLGPFFAFAYIDIDNFKAYNDVYGYEAGDKVIKQVSASLVKAAKGSSDENAFTGHIGGDDFVFISALPRMKLVMPEFAQSFDAQRHAFYHPEDALRGAIQTKNRQGILRSFPLMSLSIAVVSTETRRVLHYARLVEIASELKHFIKTQDHKGQSLVLWDRRTDVYNGETK